MHISDILSSICGGPSDSTLPVDENSEKGLEDVSSCRSYMGTRPLPDLTKNLEGTSSVQSNFLHAYPQYVSPLLDTIRETEFKRIDKLVYLDYTGATLYPESLVRQSNDFLTSNVLGNPHSSNPPSRQASYHTEAARESLLQFFDADPEVYTVVWTANASAAMRIVGEGYPWRTGSRLIIGNDSHNSMNGLRAFALNNGAAVDYYPLSAAGGWQEKWSLMQKVSELRPSSSDSYPGIFSLTGQSNVTGTKAPLYLLQHASTQGFHTLLDAAALAPTTRISLSGSELENSVDAMAVSIYKIVGYPTGVGALVLKKKFLEHLRKPWFAGGTVDVAQVPGEAYTLMDDSPRFEDGTINFLSMPAIAPGLSIMTRLIPALTPRLASLTHWTARALSGIKHQHTGRPVIHVRSPSLELSLSALSQTHGALISFEVSDALGAFVNCEAIEYGAGRAGICLRAGCMCNPGGTSDISGMTFMMDDVKSGDRKEDLEAKFGVRSRGVVRASFGIASNFEDAWTFVEYMHSLAKEGALQCLIDDWVNAPTH